jgi:hypothetical protein
MGRWKAPKHIKKMRNQGKHKPPAAPDNRKKSIRTLVKFAGSVVPGILAVLGLINGYAFLFPPLTITVSDPIDNDAMSAPFTLTNTNTFFAIHSVKIACPVSDATSRNASVSGIQFQDYEQTVPDLDAGESTAIHCHTAIANVLMADVVLTATYRPSFVWRRFKKKARFVTELTGDGKPKWVPYALSATMPPRM